MKTTNNILYSMIVLLFVFVTSEGCKQPQTRQINAGDAVTKVDEKAACKKEGGKFRDGKCECPYDDERWNGSKCERRAEESPQPEEDDPKTKCTSGGGDFDKDENRCICPRGKIWNSKQCVNKDEDNPLDADVATKLKGACSDAGGSWDSSEQYCKCLEKKVLFNEKCTLMKGKMTSSLCDSALLPGTFRGEHCSCIDGEAFVPGRAGCAPRLKRTSKHLVTICENSLNGGKWSIKNKRCDCPAQKIWQTDNCVPKDDMSIREVCTGDFNQGTWNSTARKCECLEGFLWHSSTCTAIKDLPETVACAAAVNKGKWNKTSKTCDCPTGKSWIAEERLCVKMDANAAAQMCKSSGGTVGASVGKCTCPSTHTVKTLAGSGYQYCAPKTVQPTPTPDPDMPLWMQILLGLTEG